MNRSGFHHHWSAFCQSPLCRFPRRSISRPLLVLIAFSIAVGLPGCGKTEIPGPARSTRSQSAADSSSNEKWPPDNRRHDVYTGSERCAECHSDIASNYTSSHPMGQSIRKTNQLSEALLKSLPARLQIGSRTYTVTRDDDDHLVQSESMSDETGEIYKQSCVTDFAIGSGSHGYSFVTQHKASLFQAPLTWYSHGNQWDLSPGYQPNDHVRFERKMSDGCVACHAGSMNREEESLHRFQSPLFHESSIGCERCHGPGQQHVALHTTPSADNTGANRTAKSDVIATPQRIVNPADLDRDRRDGVCYQCHLHGRGRILRTDREDYDFRPGDDLSDIWVTFIDKPSADGPRHSKAVSQVEQMVSSRCYTSSTEFGCISCHNPHGSPTADQRVTFYRNKCTQCHSDGKQPCAEPVARRLVASPEDSCIQCHMPQAANSDVPHTAQTDHRILRNYDQPDFNSPAELDVFGSKPQRIPNREIQRAFGLMTGQQANDRSAAARAMDLLAPMINSTPDVKDAPVLTTAAWLLIQLGDFDAAQQLAEQAIATQTQTNTKTGTRTDTTNESALEALAIACEAKGDFATAHQYIENVLQLTPWNALNHSRSGGLLLKMKQPKKAAAAYQAALTINPLMDDVRQSLIKTLLEIGQTETAAAEQEILDRIRAAK